ncbi:ethionine resistance protein [Dimargaris verticillata]|uniref:Ethionine resistance protein n=1 Tax=Dimargaris verticillata TaxID=2761393 RepID=A0A9W8EEM6_9FUNG|nr:ethionine resistance protein [Dimargaris verticillata]
MTSAAPDAASGGDGRPASQVTLNHRRHSRTDSASDTHGSDALTTTPSSPCPLTDGGDSSTATLRETDPLLMRPSSTSTLPFRNYHTSLETQSVYLESTPDFHLPGGPIPLFPHEPVPTVKELRREIYNLFRMMLPITGAYVLQFSMSVANIFFIGHLGAQELAAAALGNMFAGVTGWAVGVGLNTALDTLCSQTFTGSDDIRMVGVYLQKGILLMMIVLAAISVIWWNAESLFLALQQEPQLASQCALYLRYLLPGAFPFLMCECIKRFLQGQGIMHASTSILIFVAPLNVVLNYLLVWHPSTAIGFVGAPLANSISYWIMFILFVLYVRFVGGGEAWGGWDRRCLQGWRHFITLALPGMVMVCCEWWAFEVVALSSSYLGTNPLAAQSILLTTDSLLYQLSLGLSISVNTRVGHLLGAGLARPARLSAVSSYALALVIGTVNSLFLILARKEWGFLFNDDPNVAEIVASVMPIMALCQTCDAVAGVGSGILRGQGRQRVGAILNMLSYYIVAIPLGIFLAYPLGLGAGGLWWGLGAALLIVACSQVYFTMSSDWGAIVRNCQSHLQKAGLEETSNFGEDELEDDRLTIP